MAIYFTEKEQLFIDLILEIGKDKLNESHDDITEEDLYRSINAVESGVKGVINTGKKIINAPKNLMTKLATATGKIMAF